MLTVLLVWSFSILFYSLGVAIAAIYQGLTASYDNLEEMNPEEMANFKRTTTIASILVWLGISYIMFQTNSFEWAINSASLLTFFVSLSIFSYDNPKKLTGLSLNMGQGFFIWATVGVVLALFMM